MANQRKAKLVFASRLAPKQASATGDLGIPIVSDLQARLPVVVAAGRTGDSYDLDGGWA